MGKLYLKRIFVLAMGLMLCLPISAFATTDEAIGDFLDKEPLVQEEVTEDDDMDVDEVPAIETAKLKISSENKRFNVYFRIPKKDNKLGLEFLKAKDVKEVFYIKESGVDVIQIILKGNDYGKVESLIPIANAYGDLIDAAQKLIKQGVIFNNINYKDSKLTEGTMLTIQENKTIKFDSHNIDGFQLPVESRN